MISCRTTFGEGQSVDLSENLTWEPCQPYTNSKCHVFVSFEAYASKSRDGRDCADALKRGMAAVPMLKAIAARLEGKEWQRLWDESAEAGQRFPDLRPRGSKRLH